MGTPRFLNSDDSPLDEWVQRAKRGLENAGYNGSFAKSAAEEIMSIWFLGHASGEAAYLEMVWDLDPGGWKAEHLFWELAESKTVSFKNTRYAEQYEIMRKADDVRYDEWGVEIGS